jgi:hypothetical protein
MHGELLKLGIDVGQASVIKYLARRRQPPSQGWRTFLRNHADGIVAMDLFVVPTISFQLLYGLLILRHDRRRVLWMGVTAPAHGSLRIGTGTNLPAARSRSGLWSAFHPTPARHGYSRSTKAAVAMAKCLCGTDDRLDPTGMRRSYRGLRRAAPSSRVAVVHELLQRSANTSVVRQGCSGITCSSCRRPDFSEADSRRSPPRVRPHLICGRDKRVKATKK